MLDYSLLSSRGFGLAEPTFPWKRAGRAGSQLSPGILQSFDGLLQQSELRPVSCKNTVKIISQDAI